jgi:hypothetical protein
MIIHHIAIDHSEMKELHGKHCLIIGYQIVCYEPKSILVTQMDPFQNNNKKIKHRNLMVHVH